MIPLTNTTGIRICLSKIWESQPSKEPWDNNRFIQNLLTSVTSCLRSLAVKPFWYVLHSCKSQPSNMFWSCKFFYLNHQKKSMDNMRSSVVIYKMALLVMEVLILPTVISWQKTRSSSTQISQLLIVVWYNYWTSPRTLKLQYMVICDSVSSIFK